jgi:heme/copper-type cytochrome/quinol oxidase subunit 3
MTDTSEQLSAIKDIKQMMERSSRFISLSGWSGISAGTCALVGAWFAYRVIGRSRYATDNELVEKSRSYSNDGYVSVEEFMGNRLFLIAALTFVAAFISAFIFTYIKSRKNNTPIWGTSAQRLLINVSVPMIAGGVFLLKLIHNGSYGLIAPGCLLFYGLALLNGSKYTLGEIRYLGYCEIILGIVSCWFIGWGLYFWAVGFGVLHIVYGAFMLNKYEREEG